jgi:hypothetical protein
MELDIAEVSEKDRKSLAELKRLIEGKIVIDTFKTNYY